MFDDDTIVWYGYIDESFTLNLVTYYDWVVYVNGDKCPSHLWTSRLFEAETEEDAWREAERLCRAQKELDFVSGREREYRVSGR